MSAVRSATSIVVDFLRVKNESERGRNENRCFRVAVFLAKIVCFVSFAFVLHTTAVTR
jgi:hypothetical protein